MNTYQITTQRQMLGQKPEEGFIQPVRIVEEVVRGNIQLRGYVFFAFFRHPRVFESRLPVIIRATSSF